jgi:hypothetical protein
MNGCIVNHNTLLLASKRQLKKRYSRKQYYCSNGNLQLAVGLIELAKALHEVAQYAEAQKIGESALSICNETEV